MPINSRNKGKGGEIEVRDLFRAALEGVIPDTEVIRRNHQQAEIGGADLVGVPHFAVEVKRVKKVIWGADLEQWWKQCLEQAADLEKLPCLVFRQDQGKWYVMVEAHPRMFSRQPAAPMIMQWSYFEWYLQNMEV
jgi:hypothetical protein